MLARCAHSAHGPCAVFTLQRCATWTCTTQLHRLPLKAESPLCCVELREHRAPYNSVSCGVTRLCHAESRDCVMRGHTSVSCGVTRLCDAGSHICVVMRALHVCVVRSHTTVSCGVTRLCNAGSHICVMRGHTSVSPAPLPPQGARAPHVCAAHPGLHAPPHEPPRAAASSRGCSGCCRRSGWSARLGTWYAQRSFQRCRCGRRARHEGCQHRRQQRRQRHAKQRASGAGPLRRALKPAGACSRVAGCVACCVS